MAHDRFGSAFIVDLCDISRLARRGLDEFLDLQHTLLSGKLRTIATVALEYQALRAVLTTMFLDPVFLGSAILVGAVIILYDKLLLVGLIVLWDREDQQNSET